MDEATAAELLTEFFEVEHTAEDVTGIRTDDEGTTFVVTRFGNKVAFRDGERPELLTGGTPGVEVVTIEEPEPDEGEPEELPPLEEQEASEETQEEGEELEDLTVAELQAMAEEQGVEVGSRAHKADIIAALREAQG